MFRSTAILYMRRAGLPWETIAKITGDAAVKVFLENRDDLRRPTEERGGSVVEDIKVFFKRTVFKLREGCIKKEGKVWSFANGGARW